MASGNRKIEELQKHWPFGIIFFLAIVLRFWNLHEADFTHDELSALFRTQFETLKDLIHLGVRPDGHPALTQVFLYYWAPLVNYQEFWVKIPFVLAGLGSILLVYSALIKLMPKNSGALIAPLIMASSELFVYHHQIARPYALGGLFVAWAAYAYIQWFYYQKKRIYLVQFGFAASLAAYTHYLALLSVLIIGISALVREKEKVKDWWILGLAVLLSFSPHYSIFFHQLGLGGVGQWLGRPGPLWLLDFFNYSLNFSLGLWGSLILVLVLLVQGFRGPFKEGWIWFGLCFGIAFLYSVFRNPVLQYSSLLFLSPFVFVFHSKNKSKSKLFLVANFLLLASLSLHLVFEREYFKEAQLSPAKQAQRMAESLPGIKVYYHWSQEKWEFYQSINEALIEGVYLEKLHPEQLPKEGFILILDHQSPGHWPLAICDYGFETLKIEKHFGFSSYHFGPWEPNSAKEDCGITLIEPKDIAKQAKQYLPLGSLTSSTYLADNAQNQVVVRFDSLKCGPESHLIFQIMDGEEQLAWFAHPIDSNSQYLSRPIGDFGINHYIWRILIDQGANPSEISGSYSVRLAAGNEKIYGLVSEF